MQTRCGSGYKQRVRSGHSTDIPRRCGRLSRGEHAICRSCSTTKQYWEPLGDNLQWKSPRRTLLDQTASIIGRWRESYENWPVNFSFLAHGKSYSTLPPGSSEEPTAKTPEPPLAPTKIIVRTVAIALAQPISAALLGDCLNYRNLRQRCCRRSEGSRCARRVAAQNDPR